MRIRKRIVCLLLACSACVASAANPRAQQPQGAAPKTAPPVVPVLVDYEFIPQYFMQWIGGEAPYSMIEALSAGGDAPVLQLVLTERASGRRIYYSNSQTKVDALKRAKREARLAKIDYKVVRTVGQQPTYGFAFQDEHGQTIRWRFIQAAAASVQGAGLSPQSDAPGLRFKYRTRATVAGAGTAVQLGDKVIEAEPWAEISAPPYFNAYRGSYIEGMMSGSLLTGDESWTVTATPAELKEGAEWALTDAQNNTRRLRVTALRGDELTLTESVSPQTSAPSLSMELRRAPNGYAVRSLEVKSEAHVMRLSFKPELNLSAPASGKTEVAYQVDQENQDKISQGTISVEGQGSAWRLRWQPRSPAWAKTRSLDTSITLSGNGYKIATR